ncbi:hypothetical protein E1A91_A01G040000v1 [Gossypium mustelinum]|uniref:Uncharacterized protein n=3 Tax=Gossypium TaxID=3633 RepID=A0A5D2YM47_GOSMU|nr:hypothetical protein B456_004G145400 [Gossypium raimondii]TYI56535.1 hypothetical protein E1A91_D11G217200v1 [Gossypium mustelinum]TYJ27079.1 hypothetical protein E1A91_A07G162600v1 [Gossypium mustelinum]TYJ33742.1 hypothetical protein E1A91_A05G123600v1 [Gossypium mustelinum]TYJ48149.1 hypothetical protein E1A91_A01G040000v1 [Gossypium mustelinum]
MPYDPWPCCYVLSPFELDQKSGNAKLCNPLALMDVKAIGLTQGDATMESSPVSQTTDLRPTFSDNVPNLGNGGNVPAMNVNNKLPTL